MALKKCGTVAHLTRATVVERWLKMRRKHGWQFAMWHLAAFALLTIGRTIHNMPPGMSPLRGGVFTDYQVLTALAHHQQTVMTNETIHIRMPTLLLYCGIWNANQPAATWKVLKICTQLCGYVLHGERAGAVELIWNVAWSSVYSGSTWIIYFIVIIRLFKKISKTRLKTFFIHERYGTSCTLGQTPSQPSLTIHKRPQVRSIKVRKERFQPNSAHWGKANESLNGSLRSDGDDTIVHILSSNWPKTVLPILCIPSGAAPRLLWSGFVL